MYWPRAALSCCTHVDLGNVDVNAVVGVLSKTSNEYGWAWAWTYSKEPDSGELLALQGRLGSVRESMDEEVTDAVDVLTIRRSCSC